MKRPLLQLLETRGIEPADLDAQRRTRLYLTGAPVIGALALFSLLYALHEANPARALLQVLILGAAAAIFLLARRGRLVAAARLLAATVIAAGLWLVAAYGVSSGRLGGLLVGALLLALLPRPWVPIGCYVALLLGAIPSAAYLERSGVLPLAAAHEPLWHAVVAQLAAATALVLLFTAGYQRLRRDIDAREAELGVAHAQLLAARARLESAVEQRSAALEQASRELKAFGSEAAHDLLAPLHHLVARLDFAQRSEPQPASPQLVRAVDEARALVALAEELLRRAARQAA